MVEISTATRSAENSDGSRLGVKLRLLGKAVSLLLAIARSGNKTSKVDWLRGK
jgi:hypothetical protein